MWDLSEYSFLSLLSKNNIKKILQFYMLYRNGPGTIRHLPVVGTVLANVQLQLLKDKRLATNKDD